MTLDEAAIGEKVSVKKLHHTGSIRRRLLDLGILEKTEMLPVLDSPSHDMRAYIVKGTLIALRKTESSNIQVEKDGDHLV